MHLFNMVTLFVVLTLLGVEFSVSAFVNPAASRLEPESHLKMLSRSALVLGKVMPVWYTVSTLFLGIQTWLCYRTNRNLACCQHQDKEHLHFAYASEVPR